MKVVLAPDKFKGSLSAGEVCAAMAEGIAQAGGAIEVDSCPMADGGEGTVGALVGATGGRIEIRTVTGPLVGMRVEAPIGWLGDGTTAVIEMASASGLALLKPDQRNPMRTTTYGTGELLRYAMDRGARRIILGIGGSATVDGGLGCLQGFGGQIALENGKTYGPGDRKLCGGDVGHVLSIEGSFAPGALTSPRAGGGRGGRGRAGESDPALASSSRPGRGWPGENDPALGASPSRPGRGRPSEGDPAPGASSSRPGRGRPGESDSSTGQLATVNSNGAVEIIVACDVGNVLFGPDGAAPIFGPQKGATPEQVQRLDRALRKLAERSGKREMADAPGAGAAGGLGFGLMAFFGAQLRSGIDIVTEAAGLAGRLKGADLALTGEGQLDAQSAAGKVVSGVSRACAAANVPCVGIGGAIGPGAERLRAMGLTAWFAIVDRPMNLDQAIADAHRLIADTTENVVRVALR